MIFQQFSSPSLVLPRTRWAEQAEGCIREFYHFPLILDKSLICYVARSIFFSALAQGLRSSSTPEVNWPSALNHALTKLYTYTRARPPSRTLVDPLDAFVKGPSTEKADFYGSFEKAQEAARATRGMQAKAGRAVYGGGVEGEEEMDPGAWGVAVLLKAVIGERS